MKHRFAGERGVESIHENTINAGCLTFYRQETIQYEFRLKTGTSSGLCMKKRNYRKVIPLIQSCGMQPFEVIINLVAMI